MRAGAQVGGVEKEPQVAFARRHDVSIDRRFDL